MKIGQNIKKYRKKKGLTQKQLAEKIGTTDSAITRYESNSREPSIETITKIAEALGIPVSKLIEDDILTLGQNIKKYRKQKGLTQSELAEMIDLKSITIRKYESDDREPSIETITKIAEALGVPVSKLIEDDTFNLTDSDTEKVDFYIDLIIRMPELKPLIPIFRNKGYELRQDIKGYDIYLIKEEKPVAKIPEKHFIELGKQMLHVINEFTDFEFSKLLDTFTFLY